MGKTTFTLSNESLHFVFHFISFFEAHLTRTELDGLLLSTLTSQLPA